MRTLVLLIGVTAAIAVPAWADEIEMVTGEKLIGKVVELTKEKVVLDHPVLGRLTIAADRVKYVTVQGPVPAKAPTEAAPAPIEIPPADLTVEPSMPESPAEAVPAPIETPPADLAVEPPTPEAAAWLTGLHDLGAQLEFGVNGAQGNSDTADLRIAAKAGRETESRRWAFDTAYFYSANDGETSRSDYTVGLVHDWLTKDSPWFVFASGRVDFDDFEEWDYRGNAAGGVGYQLIKNEKLNVRLRAGAGAVKEFGSDDDDVRPEGSLGGELKWQIAPNHTFAAGVTVFPSLKDSGEFRALASADWTLKLDQADGLSLKFGVVNEYDSLAGDGTDKNDLKYYGALVVDF